MAISGLVISTRTAEQAATLVETLATDARFICGPRRGNRVAAVMDTTEDAADEDLCRWLWTLDGVVLVDVAAVHLTPNYQAAEQAPDPLSPPDASLLTQPIFYAAPHVQRRSPNENYHD